MLLLLFVCDFLDLFAESDYLVRLLAQSQTESPVLESRFRLKPDPEPTAELIWK